MKIARAILPLLMLVALIGAPFGMGRMMDGQANHSAVHQMAGMAHGMYHGMDHGSTPAHEPSAPHYMVCSACVAGPVLNIIPVRIALEAEAPRLPHSETLDGTRYLPPVPPPRA